jgi:hypothetical protein
MACFLPPFSTRGTPEQLPYQDGNEHYWCATFTFRITAAVSMTESRQQKLHSG